MYVPANKNQGCNAKQAKKQFSVLARKLKAKGHSIVFGKMQNKPITKHWDVLSQSHVGFDQDFQGLINEQHQQDNQPGNMLLFQNAKIIPLFYLSEFRLNA